MSIVKYAVKYIFSYIYGKIYIKFKYPNAKVDSLISHKTTLNDYVTIGKGCSINSRVSIGFGTYINEFTRIEYCNEIGKFCSISHNVKIGLGSHPVHWISTSPMFYSRKRGFLQDEVLNYKVDDFVGLSKIGHDVWIGANAMIMAGVNIGNGAIIAAGSVVTKDIPAYSIAAGVPARVIKYRFTDDIINQLERIKWWDIEIKKLRKVIPFMSNPQEFIKKLENFI